VVAQDHVLGPAQMLLQTRLLVLAQGNGLVVVVGQTAEDEQRLLGSRQYAVLLRRGADACRRMGMQDAARIVTYLMHGAVDGEPGRVDLVCRLLLEKKKMSCMKNARGAGPIGSLT